MRAFDADGAVYTLKFISLNAETEFKSTVYPNPFTDVISLSWTGEGQSPSTIELVNTSGQVIRQTQIGNSGDSRISWRIGGTLSSGSYILVLRDAEGRIVDRHLVSKY